MIAPEPLIIREVREGVVHRLTPVGELDIATVPVPGRRLPAVQDAAVEMVVLDLPGS